MDDFISATIDSLFQLISLLFIVAIAGLFCIGYTLNAILFTNHKYIETKSKPTITWRVEPKTDGKTVTVDTVWIYNFK